MQDAISEMQRPLVHIRIMELNTQSRLAVKYFGYALDIAPEGPAGSQALLKHLPMIIRNISGPKSLQIDFAMAGDNHHLIIGELLAVIRSKGKGYSEVTLRGMRELALFQLKQSSADDLLGPQWLAAFGADGVSFQRKQNAIPQEAMQATAEGVKVYQPATQSIRTV